MFSLRLAAAGGAIAALAAAQAPPPRYDVVITNGRIVDGTGAPWYRGDVAIAGDRIAAVGVASDRGAASIVDAANLVIAPGFIDLLGQSEFNVLVDGRAASKVLQGVTTEVTGEGSSIAPVNDRMIADAAPNAAHFGVVYFSHQRSESARIFESLDEVFTIAEQARIPAEIWHLKTAYKANFGRMPEVLRRLEAARARGLDVTADQYPYTRASNGLDSCLPLWAREGGFEKLVERLKDPATRERIKKDMDDPNAATWENQWYGANGGDGVMIASVLDPALRKWEGMTLTQIGREIGRAHV